MSSNITSISIIGLGKLGSPMVAAFASKGFKVIGVDKNPEFVRLINEGKPPVFEHRLAEYLDKNKERISATQDFKGAVLNSDITFIIVPTPSEKDGSFSTKYAVEAAEKIGEILREKPDFHLVVLTSTVLPLACQEELLPTLEKYSGKKCGIDFGLCYNPEFIALGNVIDGLLKPDLVLIGESDQKSGEILESFYNDFCEGNPPIKRMSIVNAEIAKISLNAYVTTKISFANQLAELCEKIPGGDVKAVTDALGCDSRIGRKYLKGALGYGGPCFPRDGRAIIHTAQKFNVSLPIVEATDKINQRQVSRIVNLILSLCGKEGKVGILGLSYKPDTNVIEESQALEIARALSEKGILVSVFDPKAMENARQVLTDKVIFASSLKECIESTDLILIATPWPEFKDIDPGYFKRENKKPVIIDCWRILDENKYKKLAEYLSLGVNYGEQL